MPKLKKKASKKTQKTEAERVEERREEVLATGRKFKYSLQWAHHRIIIGAILSAFVVVAMIAVSVWLGLYRLNMTGDLLFRITKFIPMPVAAVDSENTPYSDYLMLYRSSITSVEHQSSNQLDEESLNNLRQEYKRAALTEAEKYTYATKLAKELDITVSEEEVAAEFNRHLKIGGVERSEEGFIKIIQDNFGLSKSEYEHMLYLSLLKSKVEIKIDEKANKLAKEVESILSSTGNDYRAVAEALGDKINYQETGGLVDSKNIDGGRATEAMKLEPGESSGKFISINGDGYYFVKLIKKTESEVDFVSIGIPFTEFNSRFEALKKDNKIRELIELKTPENFEK